MKLRWNTCFKAGVSAFVLYLAIALLPRAVSVGKALLSASVPLLLGFVIAYIVGILMAFYERHWFPNSKNPNVHSSRRVVCMVLAFLSVVAVVVLMVGLVLPQLTACVQILLSEVPGAIDRTLTAIQQWEVLPADLLQPLADIDWNSKLGEIVKTLTSGVGSVMGAVISTVSSLFSSLVTGLLATIFAIYLLLGKDMLKGQFALLQKRFLPEHWRKHLNYFLTTMDDCFHRYIVGQCLEAVILGALCAAGMVLLGLPYATMIGALVGFTALIPVAGAYIGAGVGAFMILTVDPVQSLIFLVFLVILQQLEGNLIYPRVVGSSLGLPGIWVLAAVTIGGGMMGVVGMLLGVPLAAVAYRILRDDIRRHLPQKDIPLENT